MTTFGNKIILRDGTFKLNCPNSTVRYTLVHNTALYCTAVCLVIADMSNTNQALTVAE